MPLGETNVILGMQWLKKAEPVILWNPFEIQWDLEEGKLGTLPQEISDFEDVFLEEAFKELPPHRPYDCQINLREDQALPRPAKIYPMSPKELKACQEYIQAELADRKIQKSNSPIAAPAFFVPKADGTLRLVIDYRKLNDVTISDQFPIPRQDDLIEKIREGDEWKTAFRTKEGLYEYKVMPFGLKNGPATFQQFMNELFADLLDVYVVVYLDDILIFSNTREEHMGHLREVLRRLREAHLFCKETKCHFFVEEVVYIGIVISPEGVSMEKEKIKAITEWKTPKSVKEVQAFLGFANFYQCFVKDFSRLSKPLTRLTQKEAPWVWGEEEQLGFDWIKEEICKDLVLRHPDEKKAYFLETDASGVAMGAILSQRQEDGYLHPIAFLSKSFNSAQCNYDTHDKELCAIIVALESWKYLLEGTDDPITIYTDHRNLEYWAKSSKFNRRHARWYQTLASFNFQIVYRPGKLSSKPDILSRRSDHLGIEPPTQTMIDPKRFLGFKGVVEEDVVTWIEEAQAEEPGLEEVISMTRKKDTLPISVRKGLKDYEWTEGILYYKGRMVIPEDQELRNALLWQHHDHPLAGHQGQARTLENLGRQFWWANMKAEVNRYVASCPTCQHTKGQKIQTPLKPLEVPKRPWEYITYDMIVKLPRSEGNDSILVVVDRFSKMAHFLPCREAMTAEQLARLFVQIFEGVVPSSADRTALQYSVPSTDRRTIGKGEPVAGRLSQDVLQLSTKRLDSLATAGGIQGQAEAKGALEFNRAEEEEVQEFMEGEKVLLLATNVKGDRESKKLDDKRLGPFLVKKRISSHAYELELPGSMKIHPVFHVGLLSRWKEDSTFDRPKYKPRPIVTREGEEVQVVDRILDWWIDEEDNNQLRYRVRWEGEGKEGDTWERAEKMATLKPIMRKFLKENPTAPKPANWETKQIKRGSKIRYNLISLPDSQSPRSQTELLPPSLLPALITATKPTDSKNVQHPVLHPNRDTYLLGELHAEQDGTASKSKGPSAGREGNARGKVPPRSHEKGAGVLWGPAGKPLAPSENGVHGVGGRAGGGVGPVK
ncbi:Retrotransposable element Tf2 [Ceratobasidium theobromae]|uniref:Retrotransposable element Tf2 n=1 Tax=Ceratobasidium theobromae TaxID=1582974 RepID=A0A5N5Q8S8_9AGAM|nr:Retrotransposable element Tf2 [Ceratobasidium theobromae]